MAGGGVSLAYAFGERVTALQEKIDAAPVHGIHRRHGAAFDQRDQGFACGIGVTLEGRNLRPATVGPLPPGEYNFAGKKEHRVSWGPKTRRMVSGIWLSKL